MGDRLGTAGLLCENLLSEHCAGSPVAGGFSSALQKSCAACRIFMRLMLFKYLFATVDSLATQLEALQCDRLPRKMVLHITTRIEKRVCIVLESIRGMDGQSAASTHMLWHVRAANISER